MKRGEIDLGYYYLRALRWIGVATFAR